jgi:hypothetical protein
MTDKQKRNDALKVLAVFLGSSLLLTLLSPTAGALSVWCFVVGLLCVIGAVFFTIVAAVYHF